jgi:prepilin-type N-terminal cleavage/methylation domain-containing protein
MRNFFRSFKTSSGFTLIELLVVIGILGILAAALIATIDPFEQLKKAQDSNVKNTSVEYINANIRYYTTHAVLPWSDTNVTNCNAGVAPTAATLGAAGMSGCLSALIGNNELKSGFTTVTSILNSIIVSGTTNGVTACFQPVSKSQQLDQNDKYNASGVATTGCASQTSGGVTTCYWCSQ